VRKKAAMKVKVLKGRPCVVFYSSDRPAGGGWYLREYHSSSAMEQHLKGEKGWDGSYVETGPFRTEKKAIESLP